MNAPERLNVTLPANQFALPDLWIEKIFRRFEDFYGAKWAAQYGDFPRDRVMGTWAEELAGFAGQPEAISRALKSLGTFPPTLPEFQALCREAAKRIGDGVKALPHKLTAQERQHQSEMSRRLGDVMRAGTSRDVIDEHWATHPRSADYHLRSIFNAAKKDPRFRPCVAQMVKDGICTAEGRLLKLYRDGQWWPAQKRAA